MRLELFLGIIGLQRVISEHHWFREEPDVSQLSNTNLLITGTLWICNPSQGGLPDSSLLCAWL